MKDQILITLAGKATRGEDFDGQDGGVKPSFKLAPRPHYQAQLLHPAERSLAAPAMRARVALRKRAFARTLRNRSTPAETMLWVHLRRRQLLGAKFRRQVIIFGWIVDFYCPEIRLVVELDGSIHDQQQLQDQYRDRVMIRAGFSVIRVTNDLALVECQKLLHLIRDAVDYCRGVPLKQMRERTGFVAGMDAARPAVMAQV